MKQIDFIKVPVNLFKHYDPVDLELFLKMDKNKKMLLISSGIKTEIPVLTKFYNKFLYVKKEHYKELLSVSKDLLKHNIRLLKSNDYKDVLIFLEYYEHYFQLIMNNIELLLEKENNYDNLIELKQKFNLFFLEINPSISEHPVIDLLREKSLKRLFYAVAMANKIKILKPNALTNLSTACFFCDVGELEGLSGRDHIMESAKIVMRHKASLFNNDSYLGILHHHEYVNGTGFLQLDGSKIHEYGQIIKIIDDFFINEQFFFTALDKIDYYSLYDRKIFDTFEKMMMRK